MRLLVLMPPERSHSFVAVIVGQAAEASAVAVLSRHVEGLDGGEAASELAGDWNMLDAACWAIRVGWSWE